MLFIMSFYVHGNRKETSQLKTLFGHSIQEQRGTCAGDLWLAECFPMCSLYSGCVSSSMFEEPVHVHTCAFILGGCESVYA